MLPSFDEIDAALFPLFLERDAIATDCTEKVLDAMRKFRLSDRHFAWQTGYGYDDEGRTILESIYAEVFGAKSGLVRTQIVSGTHAISLALRSVVEDGSRLLLASGMPYDTILPTFGFTGAFKQSLKARNVQIDICKLKEDGGIDELCLNEKLDLKPDIVYVQRSCGYEFRPALSIDDIAYIVDAAKAKNPDTLVIVDNCYGEFVERREPSDVGANLVCGSLIKNPGGGLALSGGYIVGDEALVNACADVLTAPGLGKDLGLSFGTTRSILQGLFIAPSVVAGAIKGAMFAAELFSSRNYEVCPGAKDRRGDIIQAIKLGDEKKLSEFCAAIQENSPVNSYVRPVPGPLPGYDVDVLMAAGTFVQGASIELSADAPIREPYYVYLQGGLTYYHTRLAAIRALAAIENI